MIAKIEGRSDELEEYTVEIREEIIKEIDAANIITRNRYGALVLNTEDLPIFDIDEPKLGFFGWLFGLKADLQRKELIYQQVREVANRPEFSNIGFRIYETKKGARVILDGISKAAGSEEIAKLFDLLNADSLYQTLCLRQKCYRARLTPKPLNIGVKQKKVPFPRTDFQQTDLEKWLASYEQRAERYATCRLVEAIRSAKANRGAIAYHDEITRANSEMPLG
ncbi:MAG: hypothetical protein HRT45_00880 [Bdellovibrionales bacterium]|nr:hypothetical protein [Bdellovibrionales bacterium]